MDLPGLHQQTRGSDYHDQPLKSNENFATFRSRGFSEIPNGLEAVFNIQNPYFELPFCSGLQTVYRNFANDIPLKNYDNFATFLCRIFFEISNGFGCLYRCSSLHWCLGRSLQTVYPNVTNNIPLKN